MHTANSYLLLVLICRYCISQTFPQNFMDSIKLWSLNSLKSRRTSEVYFKMLQKRKRKFQFKFCWPIFVWQNFSRARLCENSEYNNRQHTLWDLHALIPVISQGQLPLNITTSKVCNHTLLTQLSAILIQIIWWVLGLVLRKSWVPVQDHWISV